MIAPASKGGCTPARCRETVRLPPPDRVGRKPKAEAQHRTQVSPGRVEPTGRRFGAPTVQAGRGRRDRGYQAQSVRSLYSLLAPGTINGLARLSDCVPISQHGAGDTKKF
jgi:hypothetical protein